MSDEGNDSDYKVGYRKPPRKSQFQKGVSGNPRGRRPKIEPSRTRLQHQLDFLSISEALITVTLNGKRQTISGFEAVVWKLQQKAISGDKHAMECRKRCCDFGTGRSSSLGGLGPACKTWCDQSRRGSLCGREGGSGRAFAPPRFAPGSREFHSSAVRLRGSVSPGLFRI